MGLTIDAASGGPSYTPPVEHEELPPGGVPEPGPPDLRAQQQAETLAALPGEVADGALHLAVGTLEGLWDGTAGVAQEFVCNAVDSVQLPVWSLRHSIDQSQQFLKSGQVNAWRHGPAPAFNPEVRIAPPRVWSANVQAMERGTPSIAHDGNAGPLEHLARNTPGPNLAFVGQEALQAAEKGNLRQLARVGAALLPGLALLRYASPRTAASSAAEHASPVAKPHQPKAAPATSPATPPTTAPGSLQLVRASGPVNPPIIDMEHGLPLRRSLADRMADGPADTRVAAIENGMGDSNSGKLPGHPKVTSLGMQASAETVMQRFGWDRAQFDLAIATEDPRLAGTRFEDPVARDPLLRTTVVDMIRNEEYQETRRITIKPELQLELITGLRELGGKVASATDIAAEQQARANAIKASLPALEDHLEAVSNAGLTNAVTLASEALTKLKAYLACFEQAGGRAR